MSASVRSTTGRSSLRQPSTRPSTVTGGRLTRASSVRPGAISPAESIASAAPAGTKRKERDFETDACGDEETNINVVVRCRGRNQREVKENSAVVVATDGVKGQSIDLFMGANALSNKSYRFDRVFSQAADQSLVFDDTVKPILEEVGHSSLCDWAEISYTDCVKSRCWPATIAPSSHTDKQAQERRTPCPAT